MRCNCVNLACVIIHDAPEVQVPIAQIFMIRRHYPQTQCMARI